MRHLIIRDSLREHRAMEEFEENRLLLMSSYKFYVTEDSTVHNHRESDSRTKGILKQSLLPTTIYPSPGGITLVLPFFLLFQIPRNPVVRLPERQTVSCWLHR
jgi:hypothetical protein